MTLIEITVTLAIVAMLMVAAMSVANNMVRSEARAKAMHNDAWLHAPLRDMLTYDMMHATQYGDSGHGYVLTTQVSLDAGTMELRHMPVEVTYALRKYGQRAWLVRVQHPLTAGADLTEMVCADVKEFRMETLASDGPTTLVATVEFSDPRREPLTVAVAKD